MKFSEYGHHLDNSDTLSEGQKMRIKELLSEAKSKVKELKKAQAEKVSEEKSSTGGEIDRSTKGVTKHKENSKRFSDEEHTEPKSQAKSQSAADKAGDKAADKAEEKEGKNWEKRFGKGSVTRVKDGKKVDEALKGGQKKLDTDNDDDIDAKDLAALRAKKKVKEGNGDGNLANNAKPYDKVTRGDVIAGRLGKDAKGGKKVKEGKECNECGMVMEKCSCMHESAPSAGLSKAKKSAVVKDAKAGKDLGKPGKSFDKVAKKAGGGEKGEKIAAAAMWKNMKETTAYMAERKKKEKVTDENLTVVPNPSGADSADRAKELGAMMPAPAGKKDPISTTKESIDLARMRQLTGRLNQNEKPALAENREVDQIRALTKRLLG
jgi:hypothetical protein